MKKREEREKEEESIDVSRDALFLALFLFTVLLYILNNNEKRINLNRIQYTYFSSRYYVANYENCFKSTEYSVKS